jgi:hypothetical protein
MKIYFAGSIRGGREDAAVYKSLIEFLSSYGQVLTEHVGDVLLSEAGDDGPNDQHIHDRDLAWLFGCDVVIAEASVPSLGVGYELGRAVEWKKPILCLHRLGSDRPLSAMIAGSSGIRMATYSSVEDAKRILKAFLVEKE